jgi:DNA polymerase II small subunit/DNA polymerase delta subunit B
MQELFEKIQHLINKEKIRNIRELAEVLELQEHEIRGLLEMMIIQGALLAVNQDEVIKLKKNMKGTESYEDREDLHLVRLLIISDTHLGSKFDRPDILDYLYDKAEEKGVKYVLHGGDFTDGKSNRPEHQYELKELSYEGQIDYAVNKYPKKEGIKTFTISGN